MNIELNLKTSYTITENMIDLGNLYVNRVQTTAFLQAEEFQ